MGSDHVSRSLRRLTWRLGRSLYLRARRDEPNVIHGNGEAYLQDTVLQRFSSEGRLIAFDVGANVGEWSLSLLGAASAHTVQCDLYAFEPIPGTFAHLDNVLRSQRNEHRIAAFDWALSDASGTLQMHVVANLGGTNSAYPSLFGNQTSAIEVKCFAIDDACSSLDVGRIDLLKCDAEGHDFNVLLGARRMLGDGRISVAQFEYNAKWIQARHYLKDVFDLIRGLDYHVGKVTRGGVEFFSGWHPELERFFESNYVLVHKTCLDWVDGVWGEFDECNTYRAAPRNS